MNQALIQLKEEVGWRKRRGLIKTDFRLLDHGTEHRFDPWLLRARIAESIDRGQRLQLEDLLFPS